MSCSDIVYYNITIGTNTTGVDTEKASIVAQNSLPILDDPSQYYGSIVRLNIPQFEIPIAYFDVTTTGGIVTDVNKGIYIWSVQYGATTVSQNVEWVQQDFTQTVPQTGTSAPTPSPYYFIYDYETVINIWNTALSTAYSTLQTSVGAPLTAGTPPFFYYNPSTQQISLYSVQSFSEPSGGNYLKIFANNVLEPFIHGFKYTQFSDPILTSQLNIQSYPNNTNALNHVTLNSVVYIQVMQEEVNLNYWNMLRNIYITTTMPVEQEAYYIGNTNNNLGQNLLLQSTLTDYIPDLTQGGQANVAGSQFIYNAPSLWRIFQMNSHTPLFNISAAIYYADQNNNIWPLLLFTKQQCNIKFMFIKKHLISNLLKGKV